jgi:ribonuclease PH
VHFDKLGERTLSIDCDVLDADGGTRTASITGGFVALALALERLRKSGDLKPGVVVSPIAAISVGLVDGQAMLDLPYVEDSRAQVDLNVVANAEGHIIEVQGTAEGMPMERKQLDALIDLGLSGIAELIKAQADVLARAGVDLAALRGQ